METFLILFAVIAALVLINLYSKLSELRAASAQAESNSDGRIRGLERALERLHQEFVQFRQTATITPIATATPEPAQPPIHAPTPTAEPPMEVPATSQGFAQTPPITVMLSHFVAPPPLPVAASAERDAPRAPSFTQAPVSAVSELTPEPQHSPSLEERLGANWLNKIGIVILVIGLAFFLAFKLKTMGPTGKVVTGLTISLGMLAGGLWIERKQAYRIFGRAGIGGGWALLFFTTYAMHHLDATRVLASLTVDLLLMLLVAAGMVLHSLRYKSQTVTGLAFLLGYATVSTSHLQAANGTVVFSLLASAILALALVTVTTLRHWAWLELAGLIGVVANHFLWLSLVLPSTRANGTFPFWSSTVLILFYWAIFRAAYLLRVPLDKEEDRISSLSAIVTAGGVLGLLKYQSSHPEWAFRALLAMGAIEMLLAFWARSRRHSAFVVLSTISSILLIAAVPYQFHGVSWPILWLCEAHLLALCGLRLGEPIFRRLGLLAGFGAAIALMIRDVLPLALFRLEYPDPGHPPSLAIGLALAALLFWLHAEVYPRRWTQIFNEIGDIEQVAITITSWLGLVSAMGALWVALPAEWVPVGWLALVVLLGLASDWKRIVILALQADILALLAVTSLWFWESDATGDHPYRIPVVVSVALLYAAMSRKTAPQGAPAYVAPAYSWTASLLLMAWMYQVVSGHWLILAWTVLAFTLFELGRYFKADFLRWQAYVSAALALSLLQLRWIDKMGAAGVAHGWFTPGRADSISFIAVAALAYWLQERCRTNAESSTHRKIGLLFGASATLLLALWLPLVIPSWGQAESISILCALLATALLAVALATRRATFQIHGIGIACGVGFYTAIYLITNELAASDLPWWQSNLARIGLASGILLSDLVFAYRLRAIQRTGPTWEALGAPMQTGLSHPEQWFFFAPFGMMIVTLAIELRTGHLTLGWSLLGLGAFVFALILNERSFRLGGLALLLLSVVKVLLIDVWTLAPADRYTTLIVMGCALLLVSFLYTRFREVFRKYL